MDNNNQDIAGQTEIPVNQLEKEKNKKFNIAELPVRKVLIGLGGLVIVVSIVIGVIVVLGNSGKTQQGTSSIRESAQSAYDSGDYDRAEELISQALSSEPSNPELIAGQIQVLAAKGNETGQEAQYFEQAKPLIEEGLKNSPNNYELLVAAGYAHETNGDYDKALEYYDKALEVNPESSQAWFNKGHVLFFLGRYEEGKEAYARSYELDSNNPFTLIALGNIALSTSQDEALDYFLAASAVETAPVGVKAEALTAAAIVKTSQLTDIKGALALSRQAVDLNPNFSPALAAYSFASFLSGDARTAEEYILKSMEANPRISKNYNTYAQMLRYNQKFPETIQYQTMAIEAVDNDNTLVGPEQKILTRAYYQYDLAKTYDMGNIEGDIISLLESAVQDNPKIKDQIVQDYQQFGFFQRISEDPRFIALVN